MTQEDFIKTLTLRPTFKGVDHAVLKDALASLIPAAINRIVVRYPFKFASGEADVEGGAVVGQADYTCPGNNNNAMEIIDVRYGDNLDKLIEMFDTDMDEENTFTVNDDDTVAVYAWSRIADSDGLPVIRLTGIPATAGEVIRYRYTRNDIRIEEYPEEWTYVLQDAVMACMGDTGITADGNIIPNYARNQFEKSVYEMVAFYNKTSGPRPARQNRETINRNIERNNLHGY